MILHIYPSALDHQLTAICCSSNTRSLSQLQLHSETFNCLSNLLLKYPHLKKHQFRVHGPESTVDGKSHVRVFVRVFVSRHSRVLIILAIPSTCFSTCSLTLLLQYPHLVGLLQPSTFTCTLNLDLNPLPAPPIPAPSQLSSDFMLYPWSSSCNLSLKNVL